MQHYQAHDEVILSLKYPVEPTAQEFLNLKNVFLETPKFLNLVRMYVSLLTIVFDSIITLDTVLEIHIWQKRLVSLLNEGIF